MLRWDLSPLGYLPTAAHGHLDALHLSIWVNGVAMVIDPGTGAYYADPRLRWWLASREAHNGPSPVRWFSPARLGDFLWSAHHDPPRLEVTGREAAVGQWNLVDHSMKRTITALANAAGRRVEDVCRNFGEDLGFVVRWQFAPGSWVKRISQRSFSVHHAKAAVRIEVDENWSVVELFEPVAQEEQRRSTASPSGSLEGIVSPAFRQVCRAPFLKLTARPGDKPCVFTTAFLASAPA